MGTQFRCPFHRTPEVVIHLSFSGLKREIRNKNSILHLGGNVNWCSHCGKQYGGSLKILKIGLPYDPAIPLSVIYLEKHMVQKDTRTKMFIAALFTIVKT